MIIKSIYINLPIKDISKTRIFWSKLGFTFDELFSDEKTLCLVLNEGKVYFMLIASDYFAKFTNRPIADSTTTQVLVAIEVESREKVDEIVSLALENGASRYVESKDQGWMYYDSFADPDGHQWGVMFIDESKIPS